MIRRLTSYFRIGYARTLVYMLQNTEYQVRPYLKWYWRTTDFSRVMRRRTLDSTRSARLLVNAVKAGMFAQYVIGVTVAVMGSGSIVYVGAGLVVLAPVVWAHLIAVPLLLGRALIVTPRERKLVAQSASIFAQHPGTTIGVAGSYGKTSMKELLATVLSEAKKVAVTPANKNVAVSHARFATQLAGDEDVLVIEYGEGRPGDVERFAQTTQPDIGIITGLAPAHLDQYSTLEAAGKDIFSLADYLGDAHLYVNSESRSTEQFIKPAHVLYGSERVGAWQIQDIQVTYDGTSFVMSKDDHKLMLHSGLLGKHHVGPLAAAVCIGLELGLSEQQAIDGVGKTLPHEHRMQPRSLGGGWVIDDTYNGNIDGIEAGLDLLRTLPATRKIYVTPGLVDQGIETETVHRKMGEFIAQAAPDEVVLMENSVTKFIQTGMQSAGYEGKVRIEHDPLGFYTNLDHIVAAGDLILMQNDWTDNYN